MKNESKKNAPKDVGASNEAKTQPLAATKINGPYYANRPDSNQNIRAMRTEHGTLLYEYRQNQKAKRFMISEHAGYIYAELREWYKDGDEWKPSRKGCTIPLDEMAAFSQALSEYSKAN